MNYQIEYLKDEIEELKEANKKLKARIGRFQVVVKELRSKLKYAQSVMDLIHPNYGSGP